VNLLRQSSPSTDSLKRISNLDFFLASAVALTTFIQYLPSLRNGFVNWDDGPYFVDNTHIRSLDFAFVKWIFFDFHAGYWHPITWISHALDYAVWGLNPFGHHLTNNILHAINTYLVVILVMTVMKIHGRRAGQEGAPFFTPGMILAAGGVTGLLFGLHPLHVESAVWVAERKDLLCALFFLLTFLVYIKYADNKTTNQGEITLLSACSDRRYLWALFFFVLSIFGKPMAVSLPIVLLITDWYLFGRIKSFRTFLAAAVEKLPFIVLTIFISIVIIIAQKDSGAVIKLNAIGVPTRLLVAVKSIAVYLRMMVWPVNLYPYYPHPLRVSILSPGYLPAIIVVAAITAVSVVLLHKSKLIIAVWAFYVVTLIPVLGLVQVGVQERADRFTYLPSLGPFLLVGLAVSWIVKKSKGHFLIRAFFVAAGIILLIAISSLTFRQIGIWKDSITMWTYIIEKEPERVPIAYNNRGMAFAAMGLPDRAISDYKKALSLNPSMYEPYYNLGSLYGKTDFLAKAVEYFNKAIAIDPTMPEAYESRGLSYFYLGRYDAALEDYDRAIAIRGNFDRVYLHRGRLYRKINQKEQALENFHTACDLGNKEGCDALQGPW